MCLDCRWAFTCRPLSSPLRCSSGRDETRSSRSELARAPPAAGRESLTRASADVNFKASPANFLPQRNTGPAIASKVAPEAPTLSSNNNKVKSRIVRTPSPTLRALRKAHGHGRPQDHNRPLLRMRLLPFHPNLYHIPLTIHSRSSQSASSSSSSPPPSSKTTSPFSSSRPT